jgi:hypothetical protein
MLMDNVEFTYILISHSVEVCESDLNNGKINT